MFQILISLRTVLFWTFARSVHQTSSGFKLLAATFKNPCPAADTRIFSWVRYDRSWGTVSMRKLSCCHGKMALFPVEMGFPVWWLMTYGSWDSVTIGEEGGRLWQLLYRTFSIPHSNNNVCIKIWNLLCNFYNGELFQNLIKSVSVSIDCSWASPAPFVVVGKGSLIACFFSLLQKFTRWANAFLQHSQDQFLITDLVRDLGDGITLLSLVEMLGRSSIF